MSLELEAEVGLFGDADTDSILLLDPAEEVLATSVNDVEVVVVEREDEEAVVVVV